LQTNYYPTLDFAAKATYQSDVPEIQITIPIPGFEIPTAPHNQYSLALDFKQLLYDGGMTKNLKLIEKSSLEIRKKLVEIDLYKLRETIDNLYFSILILKKSELILKTTQNDLLTKRKNIESQIKNEVLTSDYLDKIDAEILNLDKKIIETQENQNSAFTILCNLSKTNFNTNTILISPKIDVNYTLNNVFYRPENENFTLQLKHEEAQLKLIKSKRLPNIAAFAQLGYGNPGLNVLQNKWDSYYILGLKLNWAIFDRNNSQKDKKILKIQSEMINNSQETFNTNVLIAAEKEKSNSVKYAKLIEKDTQIIRLRENILKKSASQLNNGAITITDYLQNVNELNSSRIQLEINTIMQILAYRNFERIMGKKN
jgi:outer membrane protein TolC